MAKFTAQFPKIGYLNIDRLSIYFLVLTVTTTALQAGVLLATRQELPPVVPLFYSLPWGTLRLADPVWLWLLPGISSGAVLINLIGAHLSSELVLARILSGTAFTVSLFSLITLVKIVTGGLP